MVEILCFDFEWQYIKSEFSADHKHAEFGTRDFKGKICKEIYSWFFKKMSQWLAKTHKKSFLLKKWIFFTFKSHKIARELTGQNTRVKCICHKR